MDAAGKALLTDRARLQSMHWQQNRESATPYNVAWTVPPAPHSKEALAATSLLALNTERVADSSKKQCASRSCSYVCSSEPTSGYQHAAPAETSSLAGELKEQVWLQAELAVQDYDVRLYPTNSLVHIEDHSTQPARCWYTPQRLDHITGAKRCLPFWQCAPASLPRNRCSAITHVHPKRGHSTAPS